MKRDIKTLRSEYKASRSLHLIRDGSDWSFKVVDLMDNRKVYATIDRWRDTNPRKSRFGVTLTDGGYIGEFATISAVKAELKRRLNATIQ